MHSLNGSIVKPTINSNSPQVECIWDIIVPYGFHVRFEFKTMKFDCSSKDEFVEVSCDYCSFLCFEALMCISVACL
jgi:hypothetical protein